MKALILFGLVFMAAACGGNVPCAQAGGTCQAACDNGTAMACHADCGTAGICCIPANAVSTDCQ
jgi:hypothetical protein